MARYTSNGLRVRDENTNNNNEISRDSFVFHRRSGDGQSVSHCSGNHGIRRNRHCIPGADDIGGIFMATVEVFESTKAEIEKAIEAVKSHGELTDEMCIMDSLIYFLPQIIKEDFGITY